MINLNAPLSKNAILNDKSITKSILVSKVIELQAKNGELVNDIKEITVLVQNFLSEVAFTSKPNIFWIIGNAKAIIALITGIVKVLTTKGHVA